MCCRFDWKHLLEDRRRFLLVWNEPEHTRAASRRHGPDARNPSKRASRQAPGTPSTASASLGRTSPTGTGPGRCNSSGPGARSALTRVAARPREREPGALTGRRGRAGRKHTGDSRIRGKAGLPSDPARSRDHRRRHGSRDWRVARPEAVGDSGPHSCSRVYARWRRSRGRVCPEEAARCGASDVKPVAARCSEQGRRRPCRLRCRACNGSGCGERRLVCFLDAGLARDLRWTLSGGTGPRLSYVGSRSAAGEGRRARPGGWAADSWGRLG